MEELLHCMICFERFVDPKILNCGHTYCCRCLDEYHKTNRITRREPDSKRMCCPTCREPTPWPENGAKDLRNDFKVMKIQDFLSSLKIPTSPDTSPSYSSSSSPTLSPVMKHLENCGYCLTVKKKIPSYVYCIACEKSYCRDCQAKHRENQLFRSHSTINISRDINGSKFSGLLSNNCEIHQKELLKYVCVTCNQAVCTLCMMNNHQKDDVKSVELFLKENTSIIKTLLSEVGSKKGDLKRQLEELEPAKAASEKACLDSEKLIKKRSEILIKEVRKKEADLMAQVERVKDKQLLPVQKEMERLKFHLTKVKCIEEMANDKSITLSKCITIYPVLIQRMQTLLEVDFKSDKNYNFASTALKFTPGINQLGFGSVEDLKRIKSEKYDHSPDTRNYENPMRRSSKVSIKADSKSLGNQLRRDSNFNLTPEIRNIGNPLRRDSKFELTPEVRCPENPFRRQSIVGFSAIKMVEKIYSNGSQPGELCQAIWLAEYDKNTFAVSDCGNKRIQLFKTSGKLFKVVDNGLNNLGIAINSKRNIFAIDCVQKQLQIFSSDGASISKWGSKMFSSPCDVAICPNGDIIISDLGDNTVSLYKNESKRILCLGSNGQEDIRFKEPRYVASGPNNEIIVSDCKDHRVKVFDNKGKLLVKIGGEGSGDGEFSGPNGVCYMADGRIVVADTGNNRLASFSKNGTFLGNLQVGVASPRAVCQVGKNKLVVSEFDSSSNRSAIKIFDMD